MTRKNAVYLTFATKHADLREALSAAVRIGDTLWVANDETTHVERLTAQGDDNNGNPHYGEHIRFALHDYIRLPWPAEPEQEEAETDTEGLAHAGGYLWLVGSHSLTRAKPDKDDSAAQAFKRLETIKRDGNRFLLARIPVVNGDDGKPALQASVEQDGMIRTAARLRANASSNELTDALRSDPHLHPFLDIPCKENGLDIEGLAATDKRVFLGLRGPVLRGWAVILELELVEDAMDPTLLRLADIGPGERPYRKHFLHLDGLGVRDLCVWGDDLLILAGPTMSAEGPMRVYRWPGGAAPEDESVVEGKALHTVLEVPTSEDDHAEGVCLFPAENSAPDLLVVYDPAAPRRLPNRKTVIADLFPLEAG